MLDQPVPDFEVSATGGGVFRLSETRGRPLVLYFYPKDNTPGCTDEGLQFRDLHQQKNMFGKLVRGIERSTFVVDGKGLLRREWRGVKVPGHAQDVLDYVRSLS